MSEMIIEVDIDDNEIGVRPKTDFFANPSLICRTSHLYLFNSKGELLIQLRSKKMKNYPDQYDASVSGRVRAGETYEQTLKREMKEELGIQTTFKRILKGFCRDSVHCSHKSCYCATYNGPVSMQKFEVSQLIWMGRKTLLKKMREETEKFCPPFLEELNELIIEKDFFGDKLK